MIEAALLILEKRNNIEGVVALSPAEVGILRKAIYDCGAEILRLREDADRYSRAWLRSEERGDFWKSHAEELNQRLEGKL